MNSTWARGPLTASLVEATLEFAAAGLLLFGVLGLLFCLCLAAILA